MTQQSTYGRPNLHPLSQLRTELVWEGKYDEYGDRREVDIAGCAMPMGADFSMSVAIGGSHKCRMIRPLTLKF